MTAALELALMSKDLTNMEKLDFVRRKVEFMQEFGDVGRYLVFPWFILILLFIEYFLKISDSNVFL